MAFRRRGGFTLIEMALVLAILSLFAAIAIPAYRCLRAEARMVACQNGQRLVRQAVDQWALAGNIGLGQPLDPAAVRSYFRNSAFPSCPEGSAPLILPERVGDAVCCPNRIAAHAMPASQPTR